ncbi:MAG: response regulator [Nitrososphaeraceae archaeon]|nr:response regulator [Nitrososphaeraceae archaeon]
MIYHSSKELRFIQNSKKCCVGFIDLVNSTADILPIVSQLKIERYYSIFINTMTKIIRGYGGEVVKNMGDCLLYYFPKTSQLDCINEFRKVIECFLEILDSRSTINEHMIQENLPTFSYRITIDYGTLNFALTGSYNQIDIFGSIVNICSKLNSLSIPNQINIGEHFYNLLSSLPQFCDQYDCSPTREYILTEHNRYLLYTIIRKKNIDKNKSRKSSSSSLLSNQTFITKNTINYHQEIKQEDERLKEIQTEKNSIIKKIIIIDDDESVILTFKSMLENNNNNYNIISFTDPVIALKYLKQNYYSFNNNLLIILDIRMKNINGIQFYRHIKSLDSSIKILFITGLDIIDELKSMVPGLSDDQIRKKPIEEKILQNTVNKLLS